MQASEPDSIIEIARDGKMYVGLSCWRCGRYPNWHGGELEQRFSAYPDLTLHELKRRSRCRECGEPGQITRAWLGTRQ